MFQNEEMVTEGELRSHSLEAGDQVRALQDSVAELKAEVRHFYFNRLLINKEICFDFSSFAQY